MIQLTVRDSPPGGESPICLSVFKLGGTGQGHGDGREPMLDIS
jgi:hypothetical protein